MSKVDILRNYLKRLLQNQQEDIDIYGDLASWISIADANRLLEGIPEKYLRVKRFLEHYFLNKHIYNAEEFYSIVTSLKDENLFSNLELECYCLIKEILCYLEYSDATREDDSFFSHIQSNFEINCNIVQVGCGKIPHLAEKIRLEQQEQGKIEVWDPVVITVDSIYPYLTKHDKLLWDVPTGTDLIIAKDICPSDQLFVELVTSKENVGLYLNPCTSYHDIYFPQNRKWEKLPVEDFCQAMIDMYGKKGLECEESNGKFTLIKRR